MYIVKSMHHYLALSGFQLLNNLPRSVKDFGVIGVELVVLQVGYTLLAKLLGFEDLV